MNPHDEDVESKRSQGQQLDKESGASGFDPYNEEFAAEVAAPMRSLSAEPVYQRTTRNPAEDGRETSPSSASGARMVGWISLALALASMFMFPVLLGIVGIIAGGVAFFMGSRALGGWSVALSLVSLGAYYFLVPYYA